MSAGVSLSMQVRNASLVAKRFEDFTGEVKKISLGRMYGRMEAARVRLTRAPAGYTGSPAHHWPAGEKGKRARRWYFAALRDGRVNPPHQYARTGKYQDSWKIEKLPNDEGYRLRSTYPAAKWLAGNAYGEMQYHIHKSRWGELRAAVGESKKDLPKEIQDNVVMVARRRGFAK